MALSKKNRLSRKKDFDLVFQKGKTVKGSFLLVKIKKSTKPLIRFGFIISSGVSKKAVIRNRVRRILSETARLVLNETQEGYDILVVVNRNLARPEDVRNDFLGVLKKSDIFYEKDTD